MGLLKLADKYTPERLENACKRALEYTPRPSLKNIQAILASGQDKAIPEQSTATASSLPVRIHPWELRITEGGTSDADGDNGIQAA